MNREIKFRVWDKEFKELLYGEENMISSSGKLYCNYDIGKLKAFPNNTYEIMQFTGLKDKNGKEIYEGDIIKLSASDNSPDVEDVGEVIFNTDNSLSGLEWGLLTKNGYLKTDFLGEKEVIGNVFENPELLK